VSGDTVPDPSLPITGLDSKITTGYLGYLRTLDLFGRSSNFIVELPYSTGDTRGRLIDGGLAEREYQGMGDIAATLSINLYGAPALSLEQFAELRRNPRPIVGASVKIVAPTGRYEEERVINVGANRWAAKLELGSILILSPKWHFEIEAGAWIFGDNDEFVGFRREQAPIYAAQFHLVRRFKPGFWLSLDLNGYKGGRSKIDGRHLDDLQRDSKVGATMVFPFTRKHAIKVSYAQGSINDSDEDFDQYQLSYQHLF